MSSGDYPLGYGMPTPVEAYTEGWPLFAQGWYGGEFRPRASPVQRRGWTCGCGRGFSPDVRECPYCPEAGNAGAAASSRDLTWAPDALELDET